MPDPTVLTGVIGTAAAAISAAAAFVSARRDRTRDEDEDAAARAANSVASWTALNAALDREISRLHEDMNRLRDEYEQNLQAARLRISELETEVAALRRALKGDP